MNKRRAIDEHIPCEDGEAPLDQCMVPMVLNYHVVGSA
jgi:hypothetical protein